MSSSDADLDQGDQPARLSDKQRKQLSRRDALGRLKQLRGASTHARPQPAFLGADAHSDGAGDTDEVDFEQWERRDLAKRRRTAATTAAAPTPTSRPRESDPHLSHAFDDLFDLGGDGAPAGTSAAAAALDVDGTAGVDGVDADGAATKKRRVVAKMDETRLLGPAGFPKLREDLKKVRIKGKGHEMQDLKRVLSVYQLWAHQMYPKTNFRDTLQTVEKLCHRRVVQSELKRYRDQDKQARLRLDDAEDAAPDVFADLDLAPAADQGAPLPAKRADLMADAGFDDLLGGAGEEEDDFFADEEAILRELEDEAAAATAAARPAAAPAGPPKRVELVEEGFGEGEEGDEDDEAMAAMREVEDLLM
ncbi:hypothetical protein Rhopal_001777-T1 [Rhodotorula paludigena]|uniref:Chromosome segregation in meiosis protein n=1 Tax=Rhodotorula paludigena TaxID=86838 RepID=A0AAV5G8A7_9BASI|nr:hypothetical protein Rhopal_001777-T1 [Rhodotorula paludigena]